MKQKIFTYPKHLTKKCPECGRLGKPVTEKGAKSPREYRHSYTIDGFIGCAVVKDYCLIKK